MGRGQPDIHGLIEEGLTCYCRGDLDGALVSWQRVLELDPLHEEALSYIDYVRMNYDLLVTEAGGRGESPPFPIAGDEPEYQIQAAQGELAAGSAVPRYGVVLDGWAIEVEQSGDRPMAARPLTFEVAEGEAELELGPAERTGVNFEDATTEYASGARLGAPAQADDGASQEFRIELTPTPGFEPEQQTPGFGTQVTDIRPRELGFVQPAARPAAAAPEPGHRRPSTFPPEVQATLRAPGAAIGSTPALPIHLGEPAQRDSPPPYDLDPPTIERSPADPKTDLIGALPTRRVPRTRELTTPARRPPTADLPTKPAGTRDLPSRGVPTATAGARPAFDMHEFDAPTERKDLPAARPRPWPGTPLSALADPKPVISAPTRDLGLRPGSDVHAVTDDDPTVLAEAGAEHRTTGGRTEPATTRNDLVLPFDPIDARSAQILDAIDRRVPPPPDEPAEDRTRRRIAALFDHAIEWSRAGELDRAVAAIDLALSEDPNSALAQKLIHRNRDTIMNVFQSFLGDLNRTPILARPLHELVDAPISPRAAFLLSRVDGLVSIDEILDVAGMPRIEAYRYLCQLFLRGILR